MRYTIIFSVSLFIAALTSGCRSTSDVSLVDVGKGYSATSVNTAVFRGSSLVTHGDTQYIAYYDADGTLVIGKRLLRTSSWQLNRTQYSGNVTDAHNVISIGVDGEGFVHVSWDHHGHPLRYCRGIAPESLRKIWLTLDFVMGLLM